MIVHTVSKGYISTVIDGFDWTQMPCSRLRYLKYVDPASLKIILMPMFLWKLAWLCMGACYACVVHVKGESDAKIFMFARKDHSEKSSSRKIV